MANKMTLEFKVNKQHIDRIDRQKVVEKSENYLFAHFVFSEDWKGLKKYFLAKPYTDDAYYKFELDNDNKVAIPYELSLFPGFIVSALGVDENTDVVITTDGINLDSNLTPITITTDATPVDVHSAPITDGDALLPVRYVTSNNHTILINRYLDYLDLGIETEFEYEESTYTLSLYAITYDENEQKIRTLLSSIELSAGIEDITSELSYTDPETHIESKRNLVFTYANGEVKRVSIDYFWNEIRQDLLSAVNTLNNTIDNLDTRLSNAINDLDTRLSGEISDLDNKVDRVESELNDKIDNLGTTLTNAIEDEVSNRLIEDTILQDNIDSEVLRATTKENELNGKINQEIQDRINDVDSEQLRAESVEGGLQTQITNTNNFIGTKDDPITSETVFGYINKNVSELNTSIDDEETARINADNLIIQELNSEKETRRLNDQQIQDNLDTEITNRLIEDTILDDKLDTHINDSANPHNVTKAQVGLSNVINTSDSATPSEDGLEKFTTGGAYTLKTQLEGEIQNETTRAQGVEDTLNTKIDNEVTRASNKENTIAGNLSNEVLARQQADTILQNNIQEETDRATVQEVILDTKIDNIDDKINIDVHIKDNSNEFSYVGDTVTKTSYFKNLSTGQTSQKQEFISLANDTNAGMMSPSDYQQIRANTSRIENLEGQTIRLIYTYSQNPTQQDIANFVDDYLTSIGVSPITEDDYAGIAVVIKDTYHIWHYYSNDNIGWRDDGQDTVSQFTNSIAGIIKGKNADGFVYAENDGTGSVKGWSELTTRVTNLEINSATKTELSSEENARILSDNTLQGNINTLSNSLGIETTNRVNADNTLQDNIDNETSRAIVIETALQDDIDEYSFKNITQEYIANLFTSAENTIFND